MQQSIERQGLLEAIQIRLGESPVVALLGARPITALPLREIHQVVMKS